VSNTSKQVERLKRLTQPANCPLGGLSLLGDLLGALLGALLGKEVASVKMFASGRFCTVDLHGGLVAAALLTASSLSASC